MVKPELKNRVPDVKIEYDPEGGHEGIRTIWEASVRTGYVNPEVSIVKKLGLGKVRTLIRYLEQQTVFAETDYSKWGRRKAGKPE